MGWATQTALCADCGLVLHHAQKSAVQQIRFCTQAFDGNSARGFKLRRHVRGDKHPYCLKSTESST